MTIASTNPATGVTAAVFPALDDEALDRALQRATHAAAQWRNAALPDRLRVLSAAADLLDRERRTFGALMTDEMGKTLAAASEEAAKCAVACRYYADNAAQMLADDHVTADGYVAYEPLGAVLAVMPWNFPFWQVIRFAAPALAAGNVTVLKHASNVPRCALALEDLFRRAGAPDGVFQTLLVGADRVAQIIADARVAAVTITGSTPAGRAVASAAGHALKPSVLELGGSDPFIVLPSADIADAAATAVRARTINNGQSCIAAKRFIVHEHVYDDFTRRFVDGMRALRVGDPMQDTTDIGPLATRAIRDELQAQVARSVALGARVLLGGTPGDGPGNYYAPTVLTDVAPGMPAYDEELFGPVASLFCVSSVDEAMRVANATVFGLGSSVWTRDDAEAERVARELCAGSVFINAMVASDPRFPFGGVKASGYGRELSAIGMREFMNIKTVRRAGSTPSSSRTE